MKFTVIELTKEDFVPYELAVKLKEKGFKTENIDWCYLDGNLVQVKKYVNISPYEYAPTILQILKWLREEKKIHIQVVVWEKGWYCEVWEFGDDSPIFKSQSEDFNSYEQAALAGIEYCLDNLI